MKREVIQLLRQRFPSPPRYGPLGNMPYVINKAKIAGTMAGAAPHYFNEFGDTVFLELGPLAMLASRDLDFLKFVLNHDLHQIVKPKLDFALMDVVAKSILFSDGDRWYQKRNLMRNAFKKKSLETYLPKMYLSAIELGDIFRANFKQNGGINTDILNYYGRFLTDTIGRVGFSYEFNALKNFEQATAANNIDIIFQTGFKQFINPFYKLLGDNNTWKKWTSVGRKFAKAETDLKKVLSSVIAPRVAEFQSKNLKEETSDILHYILESTGTEKWEINEEEVGTLSKLQIQETEKRLINSGSSNNKNEIFYTNEELIQEVISFFGGGAETTSSLLSWTTYYVSKNPQIKTKILEELKEVGFYELTHNEVPTFSMISKLTYLNQVLKETLRLHPVIPGMFRETATDLEFKGKIIPAGTTVLPHLYSILRDPRHWNTSPVTQFDPERFNTENTSKRDPLAWCPFGAGVRNCIGMQLALVQSRLVLSYLLPRFDFIPTSEPKVVEKMNLSVGNMKLTVKPAQN